ncbi:autotransporter outer membrane beta-barrel domain-containing protein [Bartonella sp. B10]
MKKSLLLYTVSAVLFYSHSSISYALNMMSYKAFSDTTKMQKNSHYRNDIILISNKIANGVVTKLTATSAPISNQISKQIGSSYNYYDRELREADIQKWKEQRNNVQDKLTHPINTKNSVIMANLRSKDIQDTSKESTPTKTVNLSPITNRAIVPQHKEDVNSQSRIDVDSVPRNAASSASKTTLNTLPEVNLRVPSKVDTAVPKPVNDEKSSNSEINNEDIILSNDSLNLEEQRQIFTREAANYLVMPHALFFTGVADISNQSALLDNMRITMFEPKDDKERGIFLSSYGNRLTHNNGITLSSDTPLKYTYNADIHYTALQAGVTMIAMEGQNVNTDFGLLGTYGKLTFSKNTEIAEKNELDKLSLTTYVNIQHDGGTYLNTFLSYGIFKGNVITTFMKNNVNINDTKALGASATIGHKLATDVKGLVFEPQAQLIYQHLILEDLSDIDDFEVDMKNPHQWLGRIGGRLTKNEGDSVSFYGKLNVIKAFSDKHTIKINDNTFHLDTIGSSIEGGLGANAQLSQNIAIHADVSYRQKLQKFGVSGITFSGGMRYRF